MRGSFKETFFSYKEFITRVDTPKLYAHFKSWFMRDCLKNPLVLNRMEDVVEKNGKIRGVPVDFSIFEISVSSKIGILGTSP